MEKVRVGLVGVGGIANGKHMPALSKLPNVEIVAFCDLIEERAQKGAKEYGAPVLRFIPTTGKCWSARTSTLFMF